MNFHLLPRECQARLLCCIVRFRDQLPRKVRTGTRFGRISVGTEELRAFMISRSLAMRLSSRQIISRARIGPPIHPNVGMATFATWCSQRAPGAQWFTPSAARSIGMEAAQLARLPIPMALSLECGFRRLTERANPPDANPAMAIRLVPIFYPTSFTSISDPTYRLPNELADAGCGIKEGVEVKDGRAADGKCPAPRSNLPTRTFTHSGRARTGYRPSAPTQMGFGRYSKKARVSRPSPASQTKNPFGLVPS